MVDFKARLTYFSARGTATEVGAGGSVGFGPLVRDALDDIVLRPSFVGDEFVKVLRSRRSQWPATGQTRNRGPFALGVSVVSFRRVQTRDARGRFSSVQIINEARNARGIPYAGFVDEGIRTGGARVSPARYRANYRAVRKTWDMNLPDILAGGQRRQLRAGIG